MTRIRTIKPEWLDDEALIACSLAARVLSIGLILLADDYGNGRAGRTWLASRVFPGLPAETLDTAFAELGSIQFVTLYEVGGQRYYSIRKWDKHQKVDHPGRPLVSGPDDESVSVLNHWPETGLAKPSRDSLEPKREFPASRDPGPSGSLIPSQASSDQPEKPGSARARSNGHTKPGPFAMTGSWEPPMAKLEAQAVKWSVPVERLRSELPDFRWYWREGKGAGKRSTEKGWIQTWDNRITALAKSEALYAGLQLKIQVRSAASAEAAAARDAAQVERLRAESRAKRPAPSEPVQHELGAILDKVGNP